MVTYYGIPIYTLPIKTKTKPHLMRHDEFVIHDVVWCIAHTKQS